VVAGIQNRWVRRRNIELAELAEEQWVLPPPDSPPGTIVVEAFRASGIDYPRATAVAISNEVRFSLLATGRFLTIFPTSALGFPIRHPKLKILRVKLPLPRVPIGVVTLKNRTLSPVAQLFIQHARELAKSKAAYSGQ
jgi:DNA-binding transcriptional LysR family regulator